MFQVVIYLFSFILIFPKLYNFFISGTGVSEFISNLLPNMSQFLQQV